MTTQFNINAQPFTPASGGNSPAGSSKGSLCSTPQPAIPVNPGGRKKRNNSRHTKSNVTRPRNNARPRKDQAAHRDSRTTAQSRDSHEVDQDNSLAEQIALAQNKNKRGEVSISHLLDLSLAPRRPQNAPPPRRTRKGPVTVIDKATYINSTCRFVVDARFHGEYGRLANDPDAIVPVRETLRIISVPTACPICMEGRAEAPRMLGCGHILCYPCYFRYLAAEPESTGRSSKPRSYKECPLCFERIRPQDLIPVTFTTSDGKLDAPQPGHDAIMRLMFRPMQSCLAVPADSAKQLAEADFSGLPWTSSLHDITFYSRVVLGSLAYAIGELRKDVSELEEAKKHSAMLYEDDGVFYNKAIRAIYSDIKEYEAQSRRSPVADVTPEHSDYELHGQIPDALLANEDIASGFDKLSLEPREEFTCLGDKHRVDIENHYNDATAFYFYQTGFEALLTKYFLAPLDVKILKRTFGTYSSFPTVVIPKVEHIYYESEMTADFRRRFKYLSHLPTHSSIGFLECDWRGVLSDSALAPFSKELKDRRQRHRDQARKDERFRKRAERQEAERLRQDLLIEAPFTGPQVRTYSQSGSRPTFEFDSEPSAVEPIAVVPNESSRAGLSFAQAAAAAPTDEQKDLEDLIKGGIRSSRGKKKFIRLSR